MAHRPTFTEVLVEGDDADVGGGVLSGEGEGEGGGAVLGAVVDDEEFVRAQGWAMLLGVSVGGRGRGCWFGSGGGMEVCEGRVEHGGETLRFVVGGDDDTQVERAFVGEGGKWERRRRGGARAVGLLGRACHDGGRREKDES